jgi:hypothetical protein
VGGLGGCDERAWIMGDIEIGGSTAGGGGELGENPAQGVSAQSFTQGPGVGKAASKPVEQVGT